MKFSIDTKRLAFSSNAFVNHSLEYAIESIAGYGYGGIEILADTPHGDILRKNPKEVSKIAVLLEQHKLNISNINANTALCLSGLPDGAHSFEPSLSNFDKGIRKKRIAFSLWCLGLAQSLGSPMVSITSGLLLENYPREQQIDFFCESLDEILAVAESKKIFVGIESEPGLLIGNTEQAVEVIDRIKSPWLGINFDAGHSVVAGENLELMIEKYCNHFFNIHIEDIKNKTHFHLIPGEGDIDLKKLMASLKKFGYNKYLTVELYTYSNIPEFAAEKAISFFREL